MDNRFSEVIDLIKQARIKAVRSVNAELINLYWNVGEYIFNKVENTEWGMSVVSDLAHYIQRNEPGIKGFSDKNMWRMKQFYEAYKDVPKLSAMLREISWTHNLTIFSRCKTNEEKEFYLRLCIKENYSYRELERQISTSLFERAITGDLKLSAPLRVLNKDLTMSFRDSYVLSF